ncbi:MAG: polymer-forming cytoskeletal protein [Proteobacteria bacterium]|nr:polymer-forming cytoskeletal protein [Pseudomonadota bacterium]
MGTTVIGPSLVIDGEVSADEDLVVEGTLRGTLQLSRSLVVEPSGVVEADVEADSAVISGQVKGKVVARQKVELRANARLIGDIKAARVVIAEGATFRGTIEMGA